MPLTKEEWIDIILLVGSGTMHHVTRTFNETYRMQITHDTVAKLIQKFKRAGSVDDEARSGRSKTATDEASSMMVLAVMVKSPKKGTRRLSAGPAVFWALNRSMYSGGVATQVTRSHSHGFLPSGPPEIDCVPEENSEYGPS